LAETVVWELDLFVVGQTPKTQKVYENLKQLLNISKVNSKIRVIDLLEQPQLAKENQIVTTPTAIRRKPLPKITLVGDLSNTSKAATGLNLKVI
jgi:circadian clock protein KaiB